jgi:hypothetical protein
LWIIPEQNDSGVAAHHLSVRRLPGEPESVRVVVRRDGVGLLDAQSRFEYRTTEENGFMCGDDCRTAREEFTVEAGEPSQ